MPPPTLPQGLAICLYRAKPLRELGHGQTGAFQVSAASYAALTMTLRHSACIWAFRADKASASTSAIKTRDLSGRIAEAFALCLRGGYVFARRLLCANRSELLLVSMIAQFCVTRSRSAIAREFCTDVKSKQVDQYCMPIHTQWEWR